MYEDDTSAVGMPPVETVLETESIAMPTSGLYVNVDVNDLLETRTEAEVFDLIGKLKDLLNG